MYWFKLKFVQHYSYIHIGVVMRMREQRLWAGLGRGTGCGEDKLADMAQVPPDAGVPKPVITCKFSPSIRVFISHKCHVRIVSVTSLMYILYTIKTFHVM